MSSHRGERVFCLGTLAGFWREMNEDPPLAFTRVGDYSQLQRPEQRQRCVGGVPPSAVAEFRREIERRFAINDSVGVEILEMNPRDSTLCEQTKTREMCRLHEIGKLPAKFRRDASRVLKGIPGQSPILYCVSQVPEVDQAAVHSGFPISKNLQKLRMSIVPMID